MFAPFAMILIVFSIFMGAFKVYVNHYQDKAAALLATASGQGDKQKDIYQEVIKRYPRAEASWVARSLLGHEALEAKHYSEAIQWYQSLTTTSVTPMLRISALHNLALAYLEQGDWKKSLETLTQAVNDPENAMKDYSQLLLARVQEGLGNKDKAVELYQQLTESNPIVREEAKGRLSWLKPPAPETNPKH